MRLLTEERKNVVRRKGVEKQKLFGKITLTQMGPQVDLLETGF